MKKPTKQRYLSISEAAEKFGVSRAAIHSAISQSRLKATKGTFEVERVIRRKLKGWCIDERDLERYETPVRISRT